MSVLKTPFESKVKPSRQGYVVSFKSWPFCSPCFSMISSEQDKYTKKPCCHHSVIQFKHFNITALKQKNNERYIHQPNALLILDPLGQSDTFITEIENIYSGMAQTERGIDHRIFISFISWKKVKKGQMNNGRK